ncbi:MAG: hypothetical protein NZM65_06175 [Flavobacteriales bacterium]|nr:hypothetical protein [Flavobacteriales bacterium]
MTVGTRSGISHRHLTTNNGIVGTIIYPNAVSGTTPAARCLSRWPRHIDNKILKPPVVGSVSFETHRVLHIVVDALKSQKINRGLGPTGLFPLPPDHLISSFYHHITQNFQRGIYDVEPFLQS